MATYKEAIDNRQYRVDEPLKRPGDKRPEFERDHARIVYSGSFRRLQGKSQIFGAGAGDYFRNRLTHSLEVQQVSRSIATHLLKGDRTRDKLTELNQADVPGLMLEPLVLEAAALAHDIGHPPYGHRGEEVINRFLRSTCGHCFESNAQNYRILRFMERRVEKPQASDKNYHFTIGLNLTAAVLLAINKYPLPLNEDGSARLNPGDSVSLEKGIYQQDWPTISELRRKWQIPPGKRTLEAQIVELADDIAYSTHDIQDGMRAGLINLTALGTDHPARDQIVDRIVAQLNAAAKRNEPLWASVPDPGDTVQTELDSFLARWDRLHRECRGDLDISVEEFKAHQVNKYITSIGLMDDEPNWKKVTFVSEGHEDTDLLRRMDVLKRFAYVTVITDDAIQRLQHGAETVLYSVLKVLMSQTDGSRVLPRKWIDRYYSLNDAMTWPRFAVDYVAGMTESFAAQWYHNLFGPPIYGPHHSIH
jgi:dGTPase